MPDEDLTRTGLPYNCRALNGPPPFEPDKWDEQTNVYNNCYNYAVNIATGKMSWPGRYKGEDGHLYPRSELAGDCAYVVEGCRLDGLKFNPPETQEPACEENCHLVALYTRPREADADGNTTRPADFHFARRDGDGTWSHKMGDSSPERIRKNQQPIRDPRDFLTRDGTASSRRGWVFCGTFCVCRCQVDIEKEGDRTRWREQQEDKEKEEKKKEKKKKPLGKRPRKERAR